MLTNPPPISAIRLQSPSTIEVFTALHRESALLAPDTTYWRTFRKRMQLPIRRHQIDYRFLETTLVYELAPGREIVVTATGDLLFVRGLNEPKLPLLVQSETKFMSTATPNGFEFVKDAQGRVTHMMLHGEDGEKKAVRKGATR